MNNLLDNFILQKTFIISLEEEKERRHTSKEEIDYLKILNWKFYKAINGAELEYIPIYNNRLFLINDHTNKQSYIYDKTRRLNGEGLGKGEIGCLLSHLELYKELLKEPDFNNEYLIFEDDFKRLKSPEIIKEYLNNLPSSDTYDVCMLGVSDYYPYEKEVSINEYYYLPQKKFFNRLTSYIITRRGAKKLLMNNNPHIGLPADDNISNMYLFSLDFTVIVPNENLFVHNSSPSTIEKINNK